jgi:alpha-amylase
VSEARDCTRGEHLAAESDLRPHHPEDHAMTNLPFSRSGAGRCGTLLLSILLAGCAGTARTAAPTPATGPEWPNAVTYEVFVHAFADSDGDGIGDFRGLTARLDYIRDLGARAIWLMPIHPSPSYHKYDVTDYRAIHPDYGTMEDFEAFLREAHARDIRVVIDLVVNHTGRDHPWFRAAAADSTSPLHDFYVWKRPHEIGSMTVDRTGPDSDNRRRWNPVSGTDRHFYAYFWSGMPDLNFDNLAVRDSIFEIGRFWLERGVDGFRLDAAKHIFDDDRPEDNHRWWEEFRAEMERVNPDVLLVGEVWAPTEVVKPYLTGLRSLFNFDMSEAMTEAVRTGRGAGLAARHATILREYQGVAGDFVDATFLSNHDQNRIMSVLDSPARARVAAGLLFTLPGAPYVYYGEEIGMRGRKPDPHIREPFLWRAQGDRERTTWIVPRHSTDEAVPPMELQARADTSMLAHYRALIALRNAQPALTFGGLEPLEADERLVAFVRTHASGSLLVVHNVSGEAVEAALPAEARGYGSPLWASDAAARRTGSGISLPPHSTLVLRR